MLEAGTILQSRYLIERQIGQGGMGTVYIATDQRFGSKVAIKETIFTDAGLQRAFEREAHLLNNMRHPALPRVSDYFAEGDGQFLVMEYIAGEDLSEMLKRNVKFRVVDVLNWTDQLLDALDYLHSQRNPVIHRDIKPQNLKLAPRGQIILLDFGLAKGNSSDVSQLSQTKSVFGYSRAYAPLEQIQGTGTDVRSDLYSLAATIYHLLTGSSPTDALTRATAVLNSSDDPLRPVDELNPEVPREVAEVLHQAMSLNSSVRPETAAVMRESMVEAASNLPPDKSEQPDYGLAAFDSDLKPAGNLTVPNLSATGAASLNSSLAAKTTAADSVKAFVDDPEATRFTDQAPKTQSINQATVDGAKIPVETSPLQIPVQPPLQVKEAPVVFVPPPKPRSSLANPLGVAAAILILAGGGLATWYATSGASNADSKTVPTIQTETTRKLETGEIKTATNTSTTSANSAQEEQTAAKDAQTTGRAVGNSSAASGSQQTDRDSATDRLERSQTLPAGSRSEDSEEQTEDTEETPQETELEAPKPREQDLPEAPPPPTDREATRRIQQKQNAAERQRINEENRKRREQGQQELPLPPAPRPNMP